jgi:tetratricopeptide (TPR) repeat protein
MSATATAASSVRSLSFWRASHPPGEEYEQALCRLYQADIAQLGLVPARVLQRTGGPPPGYRHLKAASGNGYQMTAEDEAAALAAVRESVQLALEAEGPSGGPLAAQYLNAAWRYYDVSYSSFPPAMLATEVHRTRALVTAMLRTPQPDDARAELRRIEGWLSALAGNLAFHLGDYPAAQIHLSTAARLGTAAGDPRLTCWALGAQSMTSRAQNRDVEALDLARQAMEYAGTPLRRAQVLAWAELPALARLGGQYRSDAIRLIGQAQDQMSADPDGSQPGRFGFDAAELHLHIAEASLLLGDRARAREHALASRAETRTGRPSWAAATLTLAQAEAARGQASDAAALGHAVLDAIPAEALRQTSRLRLRGLDRDLARTGSVAAEARSLTERVRALPQLMPVGRISDEPNGR